MEVTLTFTKVDSVIAVNVCVNIMKLIALCSSQVMQDLRKFVRIQTSLSNEVRMNAPTTMSNCIVFFADFSCKI